MAAGVGQTSMPHAEFTATLLNFWRRLKQKLPAWYAAARRAIATAPSSASTERVFSQMRLMFGGRQHTFLQDLVEGGFMLCMNKPGRVDLFYGPLIGDGDW